MTREQAKLLLPIIAAFSEGATIEFKNKSFNESWIRMYNPTFLPENYDYRIKPERATFYIVVYTDSSGERINHSSYSKLKYAERAALDLKYVFTSQATNVKILSVEDEE